MNHHQKHKGKYWGGVAYTQNINNFVTVISLWSSKLPACRDCLLLAISWLPTIDSTKN